MRSLYGTPEWIVIDGNELLTSSRFRASALAVDLTKIMT